MYSVMDCRKCWGILLRNRERGGEGGVYVEQQGGERERYRGRGGANQNNYFSKP